MTLTTPAPVDTAAPTTAAAKIFNHPRNAWYVAAWDHEVTGKQPLARTVAGVPLALWRNAGFSLDEITGTERDVRAENWRSKRIVLAGDGVGFSVHETVLQAGTVNDFWYANHIEAVFITEGEGELYDKDNDTTHRLAPGSIYVLNGNERHQLRPRTLMRTVCVFNPPVTGREVHDENGVYPLIAEADVPAGEETTGA